MRTFYPRSDKFVFSVSIMILFASTIWISSVSALPQQQRSVGAKITNPNSKDVQSQVRGTLRDDKYPGDGTLRDDLVQIKH